MKERNETRGARRIAGRLGGRLSYANVMATAAMFVALGGSAWAVKANSVGPKELKKNAVRAKHVKKNQVKAKQIARNAVGAENLACKGNSKQDVMVRAGAVCIDKFESSIWTRRTGGTRITGAIPCNANGQDCKGKIFARSVRGVPPRVSITWFQAQQALANSGKRLPTNAEWQQAVAGTPDGAPCNVSSAGPVNTGSAAGCISSHGVNDMVGNLWEWVADWDEQAFACDNWPAGFGSDSTCIGRGSGEASTRFPGALRRGGSLVDGTGAGRFAVTAILQPSGSSNISGFRGAR